MVRHAASKTEGSKELALDSMSAVRVEWIQGPALQTGEVSSPLAGRVGAGEDTIIEQNVYMSTSL